MTTLIGDLLAAAYALGIDPEQHFHALPARSAASCGDTPAFSQCETARGEGHRDGPLGENRAAGGSGRGCAPRPTTRLLRRIPGEASGASGDEFFVAGGSRTDAANDLVDGRVFPMGADSPGSRRIPGGVPDIPVLAPEDAGQASLYRIVERLAPLDQRIFRAGSTGGLPVEDHLELLALNAAAARAAVSQRGWEMARALWAGATWRQVAKATGLTSADARTEFAEWGNSPVAQRGRDMTGRTFEEEIGRYLRAGEEEPLRLH